MTPDPKPLVPSTPLLCAALLLSLVAMVLITAAQWGARAPDGTVTLTDFDAFYLAGQLALRGELDQAYDVMAFLNMQKELAGRDTFMPWTYPPHFNFITAILASGPLKLTYAAFALFSLGAYLAMIRRIAGSHWLMAVAMVFPAIVITARCGQNGLLIACLFGAFCLYSLRQNALGRGVAMGLLSIKPHLAVGMALFCLIRMDWRAILTATVVTLLCAGAATLAFGVDIWSAFLYGARSSSAFMAAALYPLFRMTSAYAFLRNIFSSADIALAGQLLSAAGALIVITLVHARGWALHRQLAIMIVMSTLISPYNYDYDLCMIGVAVGLLAQDIETHASRREIIALFAACWATTGCGMLTGLVLGRDALDPPSFAFAAALTFVALIWRVTARAERIDRTSEAVLPKQKPKPLAEPRLA